jgi:signal transduction histidine kinase
VARELQSKAERPYFQEAIRMPPGRVYVSPLDLNVERGRIERPLRPTVRFASTIDDGDGRPGGLVVINQDGRPLIDVVERARGRVAGTLMLVDPEGTYLSHPDRAREWGGKDMLGTGAGLRADHPRLAGARGPIWRGSGEQAALSPPAGEVPGFRVILVATDRQALGAEARELLPFGLGVTAAALLFATILLALWRQGRLAEELGRERVLRQELAVRETRLRDMQERLVATARLAALTESAATLAHELRNPLGAIVHAAAQLRGADRLGEDDRTLLRIVLAEGERLERTVGEFLALARRPAARPENVDLGATTRDVVALAAHEPSLLDGMAISADVSQSVPSVTADPDEVRQILWNLLLNAGAATRTAGGRSIHVRVRRSELSGVPAAAIEVEDEGPGPPGEAAAGTRAGLGLIVAAGIAARQGGTFEIRPRSDARGACARVVLPLARAGGAA